MAKKTTKAKSDAMVMQKVSNAEAGSAESIGAPKRPTRRRSRVTNSVLAYVDSAATVKEPLNESEAIAPKKKRNRGQSVNKTTAPVTVGSPEDSKTAAVREIEE